MRTTRRRSAHSASARALSSVAARARLLTQLVDRSFIRYGCPTRCMLTAGTQVVLSLQEQQIAREALYRDANTLLYGDNKPTEDAVDRVVAKLNHDIDKRSKFSRKRANEDEGDITYINERNRVFNKKVRLHRRARAVSRSLRWPRSRVITTSTLRRSAPASSAARLCDGCRWYWVCVRACTLSFTFLWTISLKQVHKTSGCRAAVAV
jgi:hypothetical protein